MESTRNPYFREYANDWRARLALLSGATRLFVHEAKLLGWGEQRGAALTLPKATWARLAGVDADGFQLVMAELQGRSWIVLVGNGDMLEVRLPDLEDQAAAIDREAKKKREQRKGPLHRDEGGKPSGHVRGPRRDNAGTSKGHGGDRDGTASSNVEGHGRDNGGTIDRSDRSDRAEQRREGRIEPTGGASRPPSPGAASGPPEETPPAGVLLLRPGESLGQAAARVVRELRPPASAPLAAARTS